MSARSGDVEIRPAEPGDDSALRAIDDATWSPIVTPAPARPPGSGSYALQADLDGVLVAVAGGAVAGYVKVGRAVELESNRHVLEVKGLAVDPPQQGRGIGRALMEAAAEDARSRGARRLTLRALAPNTGARALYEACGFVEEGVLRGEFLLAGEYVDDVLMALDLTGRPAGTL